MNEFATKNENAMPVVGVTSWNLNKEFKPTDVKFIESLNGLMYLVGFKLYNPNIRQHMSYVRVDIHRVDPPIISYQYHYFDFT